MNIYIIFLISILVILIIFYFLNMLLQKKIENYGVYCGYYNLQQTKNKQPQCVSDTNCKWITATTNNGKSYGWCTQISNELS